MCNKEEITDSLIFLEDFPFPPSANLLYRTFGTYSRAKKRSVTRRAKTKNYLEFEKLVEGWTLQNTKLIQYTSQHLSQAMLNQDFLIRIDAYVKCHYSTLYTLKNTRKKFDVSNRIKAFHDALSKTIGIDDRFFFVGYTKPIVVDDEGDEGIDITLGVEELEVNSGKMKQDLDI